MLAQGRPFGDSGYIHAQLRVAFLRRLARIGRLLPAAGELAEALSSVDGDAQSCILGDPAVRTVTQQALTQIVTGVHSGFPLPDCAEVFRETIPYVKPGATIGPLEAVGRLDLRIGPESFHGWTWNEERSDDVFTRAFRSLVKRDFDGPLCSPGDADIAMLRRSVGLLERVAPPLARSALSHARLIALFPSSGRWQNVSSCSQFRAGGIVFLAQGKLQDPRYVAEHLIHEALHQKLYDIRQAHSVLQRDFDDDSDDGQRGSSSDIVSLWNSEAVVGSNRWGPSRSLAAFHVYVHLAVYARLAQSVYEDGDDEMPPDTNGGGATSAASAFRRAVYLGGQLRHHYDAELGVAGKCLVDWLDGCLELTSPIPAIVDTRTLLLLERYDQEIQAIEGVVERHGAEGTAGRAAEVLSKLGEQEVSATLQVLALGDGIDAREAFERQVSGDGSPGATIQGRDLPRLRRLVRATMERAVGDSANPETAAVARQIVDGMVESSSRQLAGFLASLAGPGSADEAPASTVDERAELLRLTDVIGEVYGTEDFGLFLYSLVRMQAPETIVELGTGLGTSALWMALAAKRNGLGHVWTIDDLTLSDGYARILAENSARLAGTVWERVAGSTGLECLVKIREILGLDQQLTFVAQRMELDEPTHFDRYAFGEPIDLLFSDFSHGPHAIVSILGHFLPKMAAASSVFIDGASTAWPSYLLLEHLVEQLNRGTIPALLQDRCAVDLTSVMRNRRIVLVHLTERKARVQNSTAWLKIEPVDLQPHPATTVRGLA
jgi:hypothetical protein